MDRPVYLSIVVPCYNGAAVIETAIESIITQNRDDIEMIIVNDGSKDHTEAVCEKYRDNGVIRYYRTENLGAGHARNYGISKARGTWIAFLDADDLFLPGSMEKVIPALWEYEKQGLDVIYTSTTKGNMQLGDPKVRYAEDIGQIRHIPKWEFGSCIYRKAFLDQNGICFFEYREQDIETAFRYRVFSNAPKAVTNNDLSFYFQRTNPNSNTHTWKHDVLHRVKSKVYLELLETNACKEEDSWLLQVVLKEVCKFYLHCFRYGCVDKAALRQVNLTRDKAVRLSRTILKDKGTVFWLVASFASYLMGNTVGRRKNNPVNR